MEDAITQQRLRISEQYVLMRIFSESGEKARPDWKKMDKVKDLVKCLVEGSPDRAYGTHHAQHCLVVAGPGAGKTWMLKQLTYLVTANLFLSNEPGIRLVPIVVFVQRIVRYLRDTSTQMTKLVRKRSLFTWYIKQAHNKREADLLLQAWEERSLVIMMDGVDEAAGERDTVEEFVHFELVPSGNRVVVTSRPTGVNRELYDRYWVVAELLPLTNDLQRKVIKMQMRGNKFFDHLMTLIPLRQELVRGDSTDATLSNASVEPRHHALRFARTGALRPECDALASDRF